MPHDLDLPSRRSRGACFDFRGELRGDVGVAGAEFAVEDEVGLFGQGGGHEVVGTGYVVEVGDGEGVVGAFGGFPSGVAEGVDARERGFV